MTVSTQEFSTLPLESPRIVTVLSIAYPVIELKHLYKDSADDTTDLVFIFMPRLYKYMGYSLDLVGNSSP